MGRPSMASVKRTSSTAKNIAAADGGGGGRQTATI